MEIQIWKWILHSSCWWLEGSKNVVRHLTVDEARSIPLQVYRIRVEERLLSAAFSNSYTQFTARTAFRLIPLVW